MLKKILILVCLTAIQAHASNPKAEIKTDMGTITIELNKDKAPISVKNFITYANEGFYKNTVFHRVINDFMIQGGGLTEDMKTKNTKTPIKNESNNGLKNVNGSLAMARTSDPDSATSQFFINVNDNKFLNYQGSSNPGYAVFGKVVAGMDVVNKMKKVKTHTKAGHQDVPKKTIKILDVKIIEQTKKK